MKYFNFNSNSNSQSNIAVEMLNEMEQFKKNANDGKETKRSNIHDNNNNKMIVS